MHLYFHNKSLIIVVHLSFLFFFYLFFWVLHTGFVIFEYCKLYSCKRFQDGSLEENEDESEYEPDDGYVDFEDTSTRRLRGVKMVDDKEAGPKALPSEIKNQGHSFSIFSPLDSPGAATSKNLSPNGDEYCEKEPISMLRLFPNRITDSTVATPLPESPHTRNDYSISSAESDGEVMVCFQI